MRGLNKAEAILYGEVGARGKGIEKEYLSDEGVYQVTVPRNEDYETSSNLNAFQGPIKLFVDEDNRLHRARGPAVVYDDGSYDYYYSGQLHRFADDGPTRYQASTRTSEWWSLGKLHRSEDEGPAIVSPRLEEYWHKGKRQRRKGPAVIDLEQGLIEYWYDDIQYGSLTEIEEVAA